jgi:hypothetical protein
MKSDLGNMVIAKKENGEEKGNKYYKLLDDGLVICIKRSQTKDGIIDYPMILGFWNSESEKLEEVYRWDERVMKYPNTDVASLSLGKRYESMFRSLFS